MQSTIQNPFVQRGYLMSPSASATSGSPLSPEQRTFMELMTRSGAVGIEIPATKNKKKIVYPTLIRDEQDLHDLLDAHYMGSIPPREAVSAEGRSWTVYDARAVAAAPNDIHGNANFMAWDIDAAGPFHSTKQTKEQASSIASQIEGLLESEGINVLLVASGSGNCRHVILVPEQGIPATFAHWFVNFVKAQVTGEIEVRPTSASGRGGRLTLPFRGYKPGPGGGEMLGGTLQPASIRSLAPFMEPWRRHDAALAEAKVAGKKNRIRHPDDIDASTISLETIATTLSTITARNGDELSVHCPRHDGNNALRVNAVKKVWSCFQCQVGGRGDAAPFTLAKFLLPPGKSNREIFAALRSIMKGA